MKNTILSARRLRSGFSPEDKASLRVARAQNPTSIWSQEIRSSGNYTTFIYPS